MNPEAAFSDYPSYKLKTDHYENGSQNIENYRFIVPKFQDCLPFHEAYKALISEVSEKAKLDFDVKRREP